jgi:hypothetical protein
MYLSIYIRYHFSEYDIGYIQPEQKTIPPVSQTMKNLLKLFFGSSNGGVSQSVGSASQPNPYATGNAALSACTNGVKPWHQGARDRDHGGRVRMLRTDHCTPLGEQVLKRQKRLVAEHERKLRNVFYALMFSFTFSVGWMAQFTSVGLNQKVIELKVLYIMLSLIPLICSGFLTLIVLVKIDKVNKKIREMRT